MNKIRIKIYFTLVIITCFFSSYTVSALEHNASEAQNTPIFSHHVGIRMNLPIGYKKTKAQKEMLNSKDYINYRLKIFKNITLSSLKAQSKTNFHIWIFAHVSASDFFKEELNKIEKKTKNLHVLWIKGAGSYKYFIKAWNTALDEYLRTQEPQAKYLLTTRIDDDDALHLDGIKTLQKYFFQMIQENPGIEIGGILGGKNLIFLDYQTGKLKKESYIYTSVGQTYFYKVGINFDRKNVYEFPHTSLLGRKGYEKRSYLKEIKPFNKKQEIIDEEFPFGLYLLHKYNVSRDWKGFDKKYEGVEEPRDKDILKQFGVKYYYSDKLQ